MTASENKKLVEHIFNETADGNWQPLIETLADDFRTPGFRDARAACQSVYARRRVGRRRCPAGREPLATQAE